MGFASNLCCIRKRNPDEDMCLLIDKSSEPQKFNSTKHGNCEPLSILSEEDSSDSSITQKASNLKLIHSNSGKVIEFNTINEDIYIWALVNLCDNFKSNNSIKLNTATLKHLPSHSHKQSTAKHHKIEAKVIKLKPATGLNLGLEHYSYDCTKATEVSEINIVKNKEKALNEFRKRHSKASTKDKSKECCVFNSEICNISEIHNDKTNKETSFEGDSKMLTEMDSELDYELTSFDKIKLLNKMIRKRKFKNESNY